MTSGENWPEAQRGAQLLALHDLALGGLDGLADRCHGEHAGGQVDRAADVHAGIEQGRERAREPADVELAAERAEDRSPQDQAVDQGLARRGLVEPIDQERSADQHQGNEPPPDPAHEIAEGQEGAAGQGKLDFPVDILEHGREHGKQNDGEQGDHAAGHGQHDDGIDHGRPGLANQALACLVMIAHHPQGFGHAAPGLGDTDHAQKHGAENLGLAGHRLFQGRASFDGQPHPADGRA